MSHRAVPGRVLTAGLLVVSCCAPAAHPAAEVQARIARQSVSVGETAALEVVVKGAFTGRRDPEFEVPAGLAVLGSSRSQSHQDPDTCSSGLQGAGSRSSGTSRGSIRSTYRCPVVRASSRRSIARIDPRLLPPLVRFSRRGRRSGGGAG